MYLLAVCIFFGKMCMTVLCQFFFIRLSLCCWVLGVLYVFCIPGP
jgi:hypothetical protein